MPIKFKDKRVKTSITLDKMVHDAVRKLAENDERSLSKYIEILIKNHIENVQKGKQTEIK